MPWIAICERLRPNSGNESDKTYVNVYTSVREIGTDAATFIAQNPTHPWADPDFNEFIVDITEDEARTVKGFYDGRGNLPRWQNKTSGSATLTERGSFINPMNDTSAFTLDVPLIDNRSIVRLYDADPGLGGVQIANMEFDEGSSSGEEVIYLKLFDEQDVPSVINGQNLRMEISGFVLTFDFTQGVTTFNVNTAIPGDIRFRSDGRFRVLGPGGEKQVRFRIFGRSISAGA